MDKKTFSPPSAPYVQPPVDDNADPPWNGGYNFAPCIDCGTMTWLRCEACKKTPLCAACPDAESLRVCPDCALTPEQRDDAHARWGSRWWDGTSDRRAA